MAYLLDTGVLLRLANQEDAQHQLVRLAIEKLAVRQERLVTTTQNVAEFWNVATRPTTENGLGQQVVDVTGAIQSVIEPLCTVLREHSRHFAELKRLLATHQIVGKQVHDARLVASMITWKVKRILTLNEKHFRRFEVEGVLVDSPQAIAATSDPD
jgi:predicted nucleic acid-binding protein